MLPLLGLPLVLWINTRGQYSIGNRGAVGMVYKVKAYCHIQTQYGLYIIENSHIVNCPTPIIGRIPKLR